MCELFSLKVLLHIQKSLFMSIAWQLTKKFEFVTWVSFGIIKVGVITQNGLIVIMTQLYLTSIKVVYLWRFRIIGCCCCVWRRGREKISRVVALNRHQINLHVITYLLFFVLVFGGSINHSYSLHNDSCSSWFIFSVTITNWWFYCNNKKLYNRAIEIFYQENSAHSPILINSINNKPFCKYFQN